MAHTYTLNDPNIKFKSQTIKLGAKSHGEIIKDGDIVFEGDVPGQITWKKSGKNIVITVYKLKEGVPTTKVLGKITIKNVGKKDIVSGQGEEGYHASLKTTSGGVAVDVPDFFIEEYELGKGDGYTRSQKLTGTYLDETFLGGDKKDTIKTVGGDNTVLGGKGSDKIYSGEGEDYIELRKGDALISKKGKGGDIIYKSNDSDTLDINAEEGDIITYNRKKNDLIVERTSAVGTDRVTIKKYFSEVNPTKRINITSLTPESEMVISGNKNASNTLVGTMYNDSITGGKKKDNISTKAGDDTIIGEKGDDAITIDGSGKKTIELNKGDGHDTVYVDTDNIGEVALRMAPAADDTVFTYRKDFQDLTITATHGDKVSESVTLKNYFDVNVNGYSWKEGDFGEVKLNGIDVDTRLAGADSIAIGGVKISKLVNVLENNGKTLSYYIDNAGLKIPKAFMNATGFVGTEYNDSFTGTTGKDLMLSLGGNNTYTTGKKGQTGILSIGEGLDNYNVTSFTAGTGIYDADGDYKLSMNGADVNDLHMIKSEANIAFGNYDVKNVQYFTDTKGISNLASIDLTKIDTTTLGKVKSALEDWSEGDFNKESLDAVEPLNALLKMAPDILDKYRGVGITTGADFEFRDVEVNGQVVTAKTQQMVHACTSAVFNDFLSELEGIGVTTKKQLAEFLCNPSKYGVASDSAIYKDIKNGFFDMYKSIYTGTSGDNKYTFNKSDFGGIVASGTGSDSFTFGDIATEEGTNYTIFSSLNKENKDSDTIYFKNNTFGKDIDIPEGGVSVERIGEKMVVNSAVFDIEKSNEDSATVTYFASEDLEGYDFTDGRFDLTVKDKSSTYKVTAMHKSGAEELDAGINGDKYNHVLMTYAENTKIVTNGKINMIDAYTNDGENATLNYTYGNGKDVINSNGESDGTYNATLTAKTALRVRDYGKEDTDTLALKFASSKDDLSKIKLFFNADKDGNIVADDYEEETAGVNFVYTTKDGLTSKNYATGVDANLHLADADIEIGEVVHHFNGTDNGVENVNVGGTAVDYATAVNTIRENVIGWFAAKGEGYEFDTVQDVLLNGSKDDVAGILACYNDVNLNAMA